MDLRTINFVDMYTLDQDVSLISFSYLYIEKNHIQRLYGVNPDNSFHWGSPRFGLATKRNHPQHNKVTKMSFIANLISPAYYQTKASGLAANAKAYYGPLIRSGR